MNPRVKALCIHISDPRKPFLPAVGLVCTMLTLVTAPIQSADVKSAASAPAIPGLESIPAARGKEKPILQKGISGRVVSVEVGGNFGLIDIGSNKNLSPDQKLVVKRDGKIIAKLRTVLVNADQSKVYIQSAQGGKIVSGDEVTADIEVASAEKLITKEVKISSEFIPQLLSKASPANTPKDGNIDVVDYLKSAGFTFPAGSSASYNTRTSVIKMTNTAENQETLSVMAAQPEGKAK